MFGRELPEDKIRYCSYFTIVFVEPGIKPKTLNTFRRCSVIEMHPKPMSFHCEEDVMPPFVSCV